MIRINDLKCKATLRAAAVISALLLLAAVAGFGQQQVNLTAGPATTTLPDGNTVPMWGYSCGALVTGSTASCGYLDTNAAAASPALAGALGGVVIVNGGSGYSSTAPPTVMITPAAGNTPTTQAVVGSVTVTNGQVAAITLSNPGAGYTPGATVTISAPSAGTTAVATTGPAWSPILITVPAGTSTAPASLQINLANNLAFTGTSVPTSIVIVGQVGGGLGVLTQRTTTPPPDHSQAQGCVSWFIAAIPPGQPCTSANNSGLGTVPPAQGPRVQSMATEVPAVAASATPTTTALTWNNLKPGTYLLESGTHPSIQVPMGLIGVLVVTTAPAGTAAGTAYPAVAATATTAAVPAVTYSDEIPLEFSEIDPTQNNSVNAAVNTTGFSETKMWDGHTGQCGDPNAAGVYHTCYPPAVNYTPFYFLINGVAFSKASPLLSQFQAIPGTAATSGTILVRMVNAGLRMHVPSIVGSQTAGFNGAGASATVGGFTLVAEDATPLPNQAAPRVQTDVFMAAGKVYDVMVNVPAASTDLAVFARDLALSTNSSVRDSGMLAYFGLTGAALPNAGSGIFAAAAANPDTYGGVVPCATGATSCIPLVVSDPSKGVIANDVNVYGVQLSTAPMNGSLTCNLVGTVAGICANGTFTYTPNAGSSGSDTFGYCGNGSTATALCTTVTLSASNLAGSPTAIAQTYTANTATYIKISSPGLLLGNTDPSGLPLTLVTSPAPTPSAGTLVPDPKGGFILSLPSNPTGTSVTFNYTVQNSQGRTATGMATVNFPTPSNLQVHVLDAQAYANCQGHSGCIAGLTSFLDYKWIIEEDRTFWVDPNCTTNSSITTPGCPSIVGPTGQSTVPTFGVNFHTSAMPYIAQGCTGPMSCEAGQTMLDTRPLCTAPGVPAGCSATSGTHIPAVCDLGNGACRPDPNCAALPCSTSGGFTPVFPSQVHLDPSKRYYISVLPGDAPNPFPGNTSAPACNGLEAQPGDTTCGHTMSGASIPPACNVLGGANVCGAASTFAPVNVLVLPTPLPTGKLSVIVFEDDFPLNGEQDGGGGNGTIAPIEPGLGGFNIVLWDTYGGLGDVTGQNTYDMFNQPLSNSLAGTLDPTTQLDACPISPVVTANAVNGGTNISATNPQGSQAGITGMIVTCPKYESDGHTLSPLAGQAVIANLMPEKFSVQAYPGADRIARGEQWVQTNTLDGQHPHDSFIRIGEPSYFQEYGPAGYHVAIGFANPAIINARTADVCAGFGTPGAVGACGNTIEGQVDVQRLSRTPDQRLYPSGTRDALTWTQCWVSLGDPDGEDFMFQFCDANGNFKFTGVPGGQWRLTIGDQWNDQIIDGLSTPANVGNLASGASAGPACPGTGSGPTVCNLGNIGVQQWQSNLYTRTFVDDNKNGIWDPGEIGVPQVYARIYYRDGHNSNALLTDPNGIANFNETFPLFNWYVVEMDTERYKTTGIHTVYDAGGPADGTCSSTTRPCKTGGAYDHLANTYESIPLPADLSVPGAFYCSVADCSDQQASFAAGGTPRKSTGTAGLSTGRIDPPWVATEGWNGLTSQGNWIEFGKAPYAACDPTQAVSATNFCATVTTTPPGGTATTTKVGENGGIHGRVAYASTRPFDDASQMIQQPWQPTVPGVTVNLYQEGYAADGVTPTLTLVDSTVTSSWDAWAQGFYPNYTDPTTGTALPYMNCPGQGTSTGTNADPFYFTLYAQPNFLDYYNHIHSNPQVLTGTPLPYNSQYKCYDSMHIWNQIQPAPYDGAYQFPSILGINPATTGGNTWLNTSLTGGVGVPNTAGFVAASMGGTNCTICVPNPDTTDPYRKGTPMLPPGKYVVEVIMPPGYEVEKEEDKNLLIGDNFIGPTTVQFAGLGGDIFIIPDQASVASLYDESGAGYNPTNYQNATTAVGFSQELSLPGFPGFTDPAWPCVGEQRVVPDYLSIFPMALETAPFAGATRPLCDRKEVTLANQMSATTKFYIFTSTHIASKFTGVITDDYTSEFDPFSPQFGEKFAPPNMPVSTKDYLGNELSRVYSDHWGTYDGLTFSSWDVNPPNITGYSPSMMTQCMNDPGPILDTRTMIPNPANPALLISNPTFGQMINDPLYNPNYSNFCYEEPYMPGLTGYLDTPVVPTAAFVGAAYNSPDCSYPDTTPAIKEVDSSDGIGPWVSAAGTGHTLTITALGDQQVNNSAYSGPAASVPPFNLKTITRHYGFGSQCITPTVGSPTCNTLSQVSIGGQPAVVGSWSDTAITVTVPTGVPNCLIQQQTQYGGSTAQCGQLIITAGNGKQSIDTVTVTIGGKAPLHHIAANESVQSWIDQAAPGDLLIIDPTCTTGTATAATAVPCTTAGATKSVGAHQEMLIMWKPIRLQGVGAASSIINANAFPSGQLLDPWRRHINCLFGLTLQGQPYTSTGSGASYMPGAFPYDPNYNGTAGSGFTCPDTGWVDFSAQPNNPQIDRLPLEAVLGWDATLNGNLAEQLQEPSLMGAYEGAGITVLAKGVEYHGVNPWTDGNEGGAFPTVTTLLTGVGPNPLAFATGDNNSYCHTVTYNADGTLTQTSTTNPYPSNFMCNPSSIDGLSVTNSSQGGGGVFVHGWAHHLQIANNRIYNNAGTLTGGISVGQGEFPTPVVQGSATNSAPGSCSDGTGFVANQHLPYCLQLEVNVHHNNVTNNSSLGDELFSATLAGAGGVTFCTGNDYYLFDYNWVCGNLSSGEGGGVVHLGEIQYGDIEHNSIVLNQSTNPTIPTNGGGIMVQGTPDTDPVCGTQIDTDCPPGLSDGIGHHLVINANLIQGNMAESGSGGGIRLQQVNGTDVSTFPGVYAITAADQGHTVTITTTGTLPATVGDSVTIAGVTRAGYNGTFTVNHIGIGFFTYLAPTTGLAIGAGGTFTDTTAAGTAQAISSAVEAGPTVVTILSTLSPSVGDSVVISGVTPAGYDGTHTVATVPAGAGSFTYTDPPAGLAAGTVTGATVIDSNQSSMALWNSVFITNNMIVNNVAGWDGAGISLQDSLNVAIINNTISSNDALASSGVLTQSLGTPMASAPPGSCAPGSCPQSAGVTSTLNSGILTTTFAGLTISCPFGEPSTGTTSCLGFSNPLLQNNVIWQNRSFYVAVGTLGTGSLNQQNLVSLFNRGGAAAPTVPPGGTSGTCGTASYWDIGVRGDAGPGPSTGSGFQLTPTYSVLDDAGYAASNLTTTPSIISQYCNGSRVPPECTVADGCAGPFGYGVPPGIVDASTPNPLFTLTPSATVDEGNNWINVSWGPLALSNDAVTGGPFGNYGGGSVFGNYALNAGSTAIDYVPLSATTLPTAIVPNLNTDFFGNARPDPSNPNKFDVGGIEFQGTGQNGLLSISPATGERGTTVAVTITGALTGATAVNISGGGIGVTGFTAVSATTVTANFVISPTAALTSRNVTVTAGAVTLGPVTFTVIAPPTSTLTSITPNSGLRTMAVNVTLAGTNFLPTSTVAAATPPAGFAISAVTVVSATEITATFTSTGATTLGPVNIYVATGGSDSNTLPFTITGPVLTSISPASGNRGTPIPVTLAGSGLTGTTAVNVSGGGVAVSAVTVVSDSEVTATLAFTAGATGGARNVTVTAPGGTSNSVAFTVLVPPGNLTAISPNAGARGTAVPVTLTGTALTGTTAITVTGGGITVSALTNVSDTQVTATFTISATAALTARNVTVTTPGGVSNPVGFTVVSPGTPTLASIAPTFGLRGTAVPVTLTGTGFTAAGTTVHVTAPANGLTIGAATIVNSTTITTTFTTTATAVIGPRDIYVTTPGGTTGSVTYTVNGPVLDTIFPVDAVRGQTIAVSLFGSGLTGTTAIAAGAGITVNSIAVQNDTQVNANFVISSTAAAGARNVTVTAPGGTSNAIPFTVIALPAPTLASVAPPSGVRGTAVAVTLTGNNLTGATSVTVSGAGVTVSGLKVLSPQTATATFTITTTAATTARNVTLTTGSGSATLIGAFTVLGPTLTGVTPSSGVHGTATPVTISGTNLTGATTVAVSGAGVTCTNAVVVSSSSLTSTCTVTATAALTARNVTVTTPIGTATLTGGFTVLGATVAFTAPTPALTAGGASGTAARTGTITVSNAAGANMAFTFSAAPAVNKVGTAGGTFAVTGGTCTATTVLNPGTNCTVIVTYTPGGSTATATANVSITGTGGATATPTGANFTAD